MDFRIFIEPQQGASYDDQLRLAQAAERLGFNGFFRSDHFLAMGDRDGLPGPTDSWVSLAGLARETSTIRLGTLVSAATFRYPGMLAVQVAQVDAMSGGRVELGLGTGWFEAEHAAYGVPFPAKRFGMFTEQLQIITGLWNTPVGERFCFDGEHYQLTDSPALPKPAQSPVPIIIGGSGPRRTPALAARFASEYNASFPPLQDLPGMYQRVRQACVDAGRDPAELTYSAALVTVVGTDEAEFTRRAAAIGREPEELRRNGLAGTVAEVVERIHAFTAAGVERFYLQILDINDVEHIELIAEQVVPKVRS